MSDDKRAPNPYRQIGLRKFVPGRQTNGALQSGDATQRIRARLRLLRAHDERDCKRVGYYRPARSGRYKSSRAIYRSRTTYEDLFHLCQQMSLWNIGLVGDSLNMSARWRCMLTVDARRLDDRPQAALLMS